MEGDRVATRQDYLKQLAQSLAEEDRHGTGMVERVLSSPQGPEIRLTDGTRLINMCSNNYLGLGNDPDVIDAAKASLDRLGYGMASGRLLCGTHTVHHELESQLSNYLGTEETILYSSCFDANGGLFETLLSAEDAIISDRLNHASIIDGVRLCKAKRFTYASNDMAALEQALINADEAGARFKVIATDGVFSMDGIVANLQAICDLAEAHDALVMVDDSHATGVVGPNGRGSHEYCGVVGRVDIITGTLGKALGGASGGFTSGRKEIIRTLRRHSRTYMFSNSLSPVISSASIHIIKRLTESTELRERVLDNADRLRGELTASGFTVIGEGTGIVPVIVGDEDRTRKLSKLLYDSGILAVGMVYPVVPRGAARIRMQVCSSHTPEQIDRTVAAFVASGLQLGIIP